MLRLSARLFAGSVNWHAKVPSTRLLNANKIVSRFLGGRTEHYASLEVYEKLVKSLEKSASGSVPHQAALLGRALAFLYRSATDLALGDINAVIGGTTSTKDPVKLLAVALRLRITNAKLDEAEANLVVAGATNEAEILQLRKELQTDLNTIQEARPGCWVTRLARGELALMHGNYDEATELLDGVINIIQPLVTKPTGSTPTSSFSSSSSGSDDPCAEVSADNIASVVSYQVGTGATVDKTLLDEFKASLGGGLDASTSDEASLIGLAQVLGAAATAHVFYDFFAATPKYDYYTGSATSKQVTQSLLHFQGVAHEIEASLAAYQPSSSSGSSPKPADVLAALDKSSGSASSGKDLIEALQSQFGDSGGGTAGSTFGLAPSTSLPSSDVSAYRSIITKIDGALTTYPTKGAQGAAFLETTIAQLREQFLYRALVDKALVLEMQKEFIQAAKLLDKVIASNNYVHMWKALQIRGRVRREEGLIDDADADFRALLKLKKHVEGFDVPLVDDNSIKGAF